MATLHLPPLLSSPLLPPRAFGPLEEQHLLAELGIFSPSSAWLGPIPALFPSCLSVLSQTGVLGSEAIRYPGTLLILLDMLLGPRELLRFSRMNAPPFFLSLCTCFNMEQDAPSSVCCAPMASVRCGGIWGRRAREKDARDLGRGPAMLFAGATSLVSGPL